MARCRTALQHFSASEKSAVVDELRTHQLSLDRPNAFCEPVRCGEIGAHAAQQIHHKSRHDNAIGQFKDLFGFNVLEVRRRDECGNSPVLYCQAVVFQNFGLAFKRNDPAGKKEFFGLHVLLL